MQVWTSDLYTDCVDAQFLVLCYKVTGIQRFSRQQVGYNSSVRGVIVLVKMAPAEIKTLARGYQDWRLFISKKNRKKYQYHFLEKKITCVTIGVTKKNTAAAESFSVIMLSLYWVLRKVLIKNLGFTQIEIKKSKIKGVKHPMPRRDLGTLKSPQKDKDHPSRAGNRLRLLCFFLSRY